MSFLEMLDVVNEEPDRKGRGADRVRPRLPRGHLRHVLAGHQRHPPRRPQAAPPSASSTCAISRTATTIVIEPWRAKAFPVIKDLVDRPQRLRPHHPGRRLHLREHRRRARRATHSRSPRPTPTSRWTPPRASAAAPASPPARTPPPCSSSPPKSRILALLPQGQPERDRRVARHGSANGQGRLRQLHQHRLVRSGLPEDIKLEFIAQLNRDYIKAAFTDRPKSASWRRLGPGGCQSLDWRPHLFSSRTITARCHPGSRFLG